MDLTNKQVIHKSFGKGTVTKHNDSLVEISFSKAGKKRFVFPDAFGTFLSLIDEKQAELMNNFIRKREQERRREEITLELEKSREREEQQRILEREKLIQNLKIHKCSQGAFWCKPEDYERLFSEWSVSTGVVKSGYNAGAPNRAIRMHHNSCCVLTSREKDEVEKDRRVIGIYLVNEDFVGKLCEDGIVPAHPEYRLRLSDKTAQKLKFWQYYSNEKYPTNMTWNTDRYRYIDNICVAQLLRDIVTLVPAKEKELAQRFFSNYCRLNHIDPVTLEKPAGALTVKTEQEG